MLLKQIHVSLCSIDHLACMAATYVALSQDPSLYKAMFPLLNFVCMHQFFVNIADG